jgi:hypothetical protein
MRMTGEVMAVVVMMPVDGEGACCLRAEEASVRRMLRYCLGHA